MLLRIGQRIISTSQISTMVYHPDAAELQICEVGADDTWSIKGKEAAALWSYLVSQAVDVLAKDEPAAAEPDYPPIQKVGMSDFD